MLSSTCPNAPIIASYVGKHVGRKWKKKLDTRIWCNLPCMGNTSFSVALKLYTTTWWFGVLEIVRIAGDYDDLLRMTSYPNGLSLTPWVCYYLAGKSLWNNMSTLWCRKHFRASGNRFRGTLWTIFGLKPCNIVALRLSATPRQWD